MRDKAPAAFGDATPQESTAAPQSSGFAEYDPLRLCIYPTIGVIAWLIAPPLTVAIFGSIGKAGHRRARRRGLVSSRCLLGDTRLVIAYLEVAAVAGAAWTLWSLLG